MPIKDVVIGAADRTVKYRDEFVVTSEFTHGDDDFDATRVTVISGSQKAELIEFLNFLDATSDALERGDYQDSVGNWDKYGDDYSDRYIFGLDRGWPIDTDTSIEASYQGSTVDYYDKDGILHHVDIVWV